MAGAAQATRSSKMAGTVGSTTPLVGPLLVPGANRRSIPAIAAEARMGDVRGRHPAIIVQAISDAARGRVSRDTVKGYAGW